MGLHPNCGIIISPLTSFYAQEKVGKVMNEFKQGKLKSGSGAKVKSKKQAVAKVPPAPKKRL